MDANTETCPECHADLRGNPIPEAIRENYGGETHYLRSIAIYDRDRDRTTYVECPDCGHRWEA